MKTISIKQPWASLIAHGIKDIENRSWRTNYRGRVLIHAGASKKEGWRLNDLQRVHLWRSGNALYNTDFDKLPFGSIIGSVEIVDCVQSHSSVWAEKGVWNWVLANPVLYQAPIPAKGKLSLWEFEGLKEVKIKCPECGSIETALENHLTEPFSTYVHTCCKCGAIILESEWNVIKIDKSYE